MKNVEQLKRQRKRQLTIQYMVAVGLVFLVSLSSLLVLKHVLKQQEGYAAAINVSGRQRMLSQRIALLAHEIVYDHQEEFKEEKLEQIKLSITLMEQSHQHLISRKTGDNTGVELSGTLSEMYFHPPLEVDRFVAEYLTGIKILLAEPISQKSFEELSSLSITARGALLDALNTVVQQYEAESIRYSDILKNSALVIFLLMVLLLMLIIFFGFRPMANVVAENESMLNSLLDSIPILMDIVNKDDGAILYQSEFLISQLGAPTIGQKCFEAYKTDRIQCESCPIHQAEPDLDTKITTCFDRLGAGAVVKMTHLPILFKGREAILHTFHDITEQKKTEDFLVRAKEEADRASELKSNFLANMSHEIRTPMNAIIGFSDLALETKLNSQQHDYIKTINRSSHSLLQIINKILDFSKIEDGKLELEKKTFCLDEILNNMISPFAGEAQEKNIALHIRQQADVPVLLIGDALRLQQILTNLLANSLKFTDQGEITVQVSLESLAAQQVRLGFSVADTGIGIASDKLSTLFDSFSQADGSTTRKYGGTGLGLAICRQLVGLLGGNLKVNSTEGMGTIFSFTAGFGLVAADDQVQQVKGLFSTRQGTERREKDRRQNSRDRRKKTKSQILPENLPGINLKRGLARIEGNSGLYIRLLKEFAANYRWLDRDIMDALNGQDQERAERLVHTVKGVAGSLGAMELAAASLTLEQAIREGGEIKTPINNFKELLQQVRKSIAMLDDKREDVAIQNERISPPDQERVGGLLAELQTMLAGNNFQADNKWQELKPLLVAADKSILMRITRSLEQFDYTTALKLLAEVEGHHENIQ